jgi:hypothetical protein
VDRLRKDSHGERSGNCEGDGCLELTSTTTLRGGRRGGGARPKMERRHSKLRGLMPLNRESTHAVLAALELLLLPELALVGALVGVAAGELAAGELAAGVLAAGVVAGAEPDAVEGAGAPEDEPLAAAQRVGSPTPTVIVARVD